MLVVLILACLGWVVLDSYHQAGAKKADFLVNISNDGWFAGTTELWQHRASSAFRCVENRVPMARSVNCGCSGFYDSLGRPMGVIPPGKTGHLSAVLPMDKRTTIYSRLGDGLGFDCVALLFAGMVIVFRQRRRAKTGGSG